MGNLFDCNKGDLPDWQKNDGEADRCADYGSSSASSGGALTTSVHAGTQEFSFSGASAGSKETTSAVYKSAPPSRSKGSQQKRRLMSELHSILDDDTNGVDGYGPVADDSTLAPQDTFTATYPQYASGRGDDVSYPGFGSSRAADQKKTHARNKKNGQRVHQKKRLSQKELNRMETVNSRVQARLRTEQGLARTPAQAGHERSHRRSSGAASLDETRARADVGGIDEGTTQAHDTEDGVTTVGQREDDAEALSVCRQQEEMLIKSALQSPVPAGGPYFIVATAWMRRWQIFIATAVHPGPINNQVLLQHTASSSSPGTAATASSSSPPREGLVKGSDFSAINAAAWELFLDIYGGGPALSRVAPDIYAAVSASGNADTDDDGNSVGGSGGISEEGDAARDEDEKDEDEDEGDEEENFLEMCRTQEQQLIAAAASGKVRAGETAYIIHAQWLQQWRLFCDRRAPRPGAISNTALLQDGDDDGDGGGGDGDDDDQRSVQSGLKLGEAYACVNQRAWLILVEMYGGGPAIARAQQDLYSAPVQPVK